MSGPAPTFAATDVFEGMSGQLTYSTVIGTPVFCDQALVVLSQIGWSDGTNCAQRITRSEAPLSIGNSRFSPGTPYAAASAGLVNRSSPAAARAAPANPAAPAVMNSRRVSPVLGTVSRSVFGVLAPFVVRPMSALPF